MTFPSTSSHGPIDFRAFFDASPNSYVILDRDLRIVGANPAYLRETGGTLDAIAGQNIFEAFPSSAESMAQLSRSFRRVLETRTVDTIALIRYDLRQMTPQGEVVEERYWTAVHTPFLDANGDVDLILQHTLDITDIHRLKIAAGQEPGSLPVERIGRRVLNNARRVQEANEALGDQLAHLRDLFQQAPGFMCLLTGPEHRVELVNRAYASLIGHRDILGRPIREALPEVEGQGFFELLDRVYETGEPFVGRDMRVHLQREAASPLELRYIDIVYQPIREADGTVSGIFAEGHDVTEKKTAEAQQKILIAELNHRVKNTLASVQSIAMQTARHATELSDFRAAFEARLLALAQAHDTLTRGNWESADLREIVEDEVNLYGRGRIAIEGSSVRISPRAALTLAMAFHEMAMNAVSFGALSEAGGTVSVSWKIGSGPEGPGDIEIIWEERGGPKVSPPKTRGFGSTMIERSIRHELEGSVALAFDEPGLRCQMNLPAATTTKIA